MAGERPLAIGTVITYANLDENEQMVDKVGIVIDNADDSYTVYSNSMIEELSIDYVTTVVGINDDSIKIANTVLNKKVE